MTSPTTANRSRCRGDGHLPEVKCREGGTIVTWPVRRDFLPPQRKAGSLQNLTLKESEPRVQHVCVLDARLNRRTVTRHADRGSDGDQILGGLAVSHRFDPAVHLPDVPL